MKKNKIIGVEETGICFMTRKAYSLKKTINLEAECFQFCTVSFKTFRESPNQWSFVSYDHSWVWSKKKEENICKHKFSQQNWPNLLTFILQLDRNIFETKSTPNICDNLQIIGIPVQDKFSSCEISERKNQKASFDREASMICRIFTLRYSQTLMSHSF